MEGAILSGEKTSKLCTRCGLWNDPRQDLCTNCGAGLVLEKDRLIAEARLESAFQEANRLERDGRWFFFVGVALGGSGMAMTLVNTLAMRPEVVTLVLCLGAQILGMGTALAGLILVHRGRLVRKY